MQTLVLNAGNIPIGIYSYRNAIKKIVNNKAELVETYIDAYLDNDWRKAMEAPAVIRLLYFMFPPKKNRYERCTRKNIWLRDNGHCQYCRKFVPLSKMHWDHVIPKDQGGDSSWKNLTTACFLCNQKKANRTPEEAGMELWHKPVPLPRKVPIEKEMILRIRSLKNLPSEKWRSYIYYNTELQSD